MKGNMAMFTTRNKEGWTDSIDAMMSNLFELEQRQECDL
jgi:hypothetical protein